MNDPKRLGAEISAQRKLRQLTQARVGRQGTVSAIENGENVHLYTWLSALDAVGLEVRLVPRAPGSALPQAQPGQLPGREPPAREAKLHPGAQMSEPTSAPQLHISARALEERIKSAPKRNGAGRSRLLAARQVKD